jgi:hypothetical protein
MKMLLITAGLVSMTGSALAMDPAVMNFASTTGRFIANAAACHEEWESTATLAMKIVKIGYPDTSLNEFAELLKIEMGREVPCDRSNLQDWHRLQVNSAAQLMNVK